MCKLKEHALMFPETAKRVVQLGSPQTGWRCWLQHWQQRLRLYFARDLTRNCTQNFTPEREGERGNVRSLQPNSFCHTFDAPVQSALQAVGQYLMQQGFKLGQDFSLTEGGILLNQNTSDHLKVKLGTTHFEEVLAGAPGLLQRSPGVALESLDRQLGVPFSGNFKQIMLNRLPTLNGLELYQYLIHLLNADQPAISKFLDE
jgi:hypothetical protein